LLLHGLHNPAGDFFFTYWTHTGSVYFFVVVVVILILLRRRHGFILSIVGIGVGLVTGFFKYVLCPDVPRTTAYFEGQGILVPVEGVPMLASYSFPSGHSMAAFALATYFALMLQSKGYSALLIVMAFLTALSRIYLGQHFLVDALAGSMIGVIIATAFYMRFEKYLNRAGAPSSIEGSVK